MYDLAGDAPLFTPGLLIQAPDVRSGGVFPVVYAWFTNPGARCTIWRGFAVVYAWFY